ncbi:MAG TPA: SRPBCC domain-containing protein [Dokdonella sp.]
MKPIHAVLGFSLALFACATPAQAEVKQAAADSFLIVFSEPLAATPAKAYAAVTAIPVWWDSEHTWSGKASNLSLKTEAGGCFCERWADGSVEHGRVVMAIPGKLLRLDTALGPLQEFALHGILSFWIRTDEDDGSTRLDVEYRVNGSSASGLDAFAPKVDEVLGAQVARLKRLLDTGRPDEAPPVEAAAAAAAKPAKPKPPAKLPPGKPATGR